MTTTTALLTKRSEVLEGAISLLETHGIYRGDFAGPTKDDGTCSFCMLGAMNRVVSDALPGIFNQEQEDEWDRLYDLKQDAHALVYSVLSKHSEYQAKAAEKGRALSIPNFNDLIASDEEIFAILRESVEAAKAAEAVQ